MGVTPAAPPGGKPLNEEWRRRVVQVQQFLRLILCGQMWKVHRAAGLCLVSTFILQCMGCGSLLHRTGLIIKPMILDPSQDASGIIKAYFVGGYVAAGIGSYFLMREMLGKYYRSSSLFLKFWDFPEFFPTAGLFIPFSTPNSILVILSRR